LTLLTLLSPAPHSGVTVGDRNDAATPLLLASYGDGGTVTRIDADCSRVLAAQINLQSRFDRYVVALNALDADVDDPDVIDIAAARVTFCNEALKESHRALRLCRQLGELTGRTGT
jgi:hypothetical protein